MLRTAERVAVFVRPRDARRLGLGRGAGTVGRDQFARRGRKLRLEHPRGALTRSGCRASGREEPDRSDLGKASQHRQIGHGGRRLSGEPAPRARGAYLYADYIAGTVFALRYDPAKKRVVANQPIRTPKLPIVSLERTRPERCTSSASRPTVAASHASSGPSWRRRPTGKCERLISTGNERRKKDPLFARKWTKPAASRRFLRFPPDFSRQSPSGQSRPAPAIRGHFPAENGPFSHSPRAALRGFFWFFCGKKGGPAQPQKTRQPGPAQARRTIPKRNHPPALRRPPATTEKYIWLAKRGPDVSMSTAGSFLPIP